MTSFPHIVWHDMLSQFTCGITFFLIEGRIIPKHKLSKSGVSIDRNTVWPSFICYISAVPTVDWSHSIQCRNVHQCADGVKNTLQYLKLAHMSTHERRP